MTTIALVASIAAIALFVLAQDVRQHFVSSHDSIPSPLASLENGLARRLETGEISARDYERVLHLIRD